METKILFVSYNGETIGFKCKNSTRVQEMVTAFALRGSHRLEGAHLTQNGQIIWANAVVNSFRDGDRLVFVPGPEPS